MLRDLVKCKYYIYKKNDFFLQQFLIDIYLLTYKVGGEGDREIRVKSFHWLFLTFVDRLSRTSL